MSDLVIRKDKQVVTTSLEVAKTFGKRHKHVLESINNLVAEFSATKVMFAEGTYENRGKQYPMYYMNRDGFTLLAMGFTGKKALEFKFQYIQAFNQMEQALKELDRDSYMIEDPNLRVEKWIEENKKRDKLIKENNQLKIPASYANKVKANNKMMTISMFAKIISANGYKIGRNKAYTLFSDSGWLMKNHHNGYEATQKGVNSGYFYTTIDPYFKFGYQYEHAITYLTTKGQTHFLCKLLNVEKNSAENIIEEAQNKFALN